MTFAERLTDLVKQSEYKKTEISKKLGLQRMSLYRWMKGVNEPSDDSMADLCKFFGVSPAWLKYGETDITAPQSLVLENGAVAVPQYDITAMCTPTDCGSDVNNLEMITLIKVTSEFLDAHCQGANPNYLHLIKATGDSMDPTIKRGDLVIVDTYNTSIQEDGVYVIRMNSAVIIKRIQLLVKGVRIISDNRDLYGPIEANLEDIEIIGKVHASLNIRNH